MKKVLRLNIGTYTSDEGFEKTLAMVKENMDVIDEVTMFADSGHHGYRPTKETAERGEILTKRIRQYKDAGIKNVGINVLSTLGHTEDGSGLREKADMQYMVNERGEESGSCLCPADERFLEYIKTRYTIFASTGADYIWMDDNVRIGNHGVVSGFCYCPKCIEKYNRTYGTDYTFEYITSHWDEDAELRKTWKESAYDTMSVMVKTINKAVKSVNPNAEIGYMSGGSNPVYEWILASGAKKGRPGGGFYDDRFPLELFWKSFWIQWELSNYPKTVTDIQYEYETYNFRTLEKSMHTSEMETSLALMTGCNGVLYNRLVFEPYFFDMLRGSAEKWEVLTKINEGCENTGVFCAYAPSAQALNEISIPVTAVLENSVKVTR